MSAAEFSVVHLLWNGRIGGIERLVHDLAREQKRLGLDVSVAFGQDTGFFAGAVRQAGVRVINLGLRSGYDMRPASITRGARLLGEADVVHLHGFNLPMAAIAARTGRSVVYTEHGIASQNRLSATDPLKRWLEGRFLRRRVDATATNSRHSAERVCTRYRLDREAVTVVHNGVAFAPNAPPPPDPGDRDGLVAAFVGRLVRWKRVDRILDAVSLLGKYDAPRVLIIGGGPLKSDLQSLARKLGLEDRVRFLGYREDVAEILTTADVLIQPSEGEPFGLAIVEACAQGLLPIVFADGGGALEVLPPDGVVVEDVGGLASALYSLRGSQRLCPEARNEREAWARETFPIRKTALAYLELYRSALERRSPR